MHTFEFIRPADQAAAIATAAQSKTAQQGADVRFLGGGTTLIDLMKLNVETPARVLDINRLPLDKIEATSDGGVKIGAMVRNSDLANHAMLQKDYSARRKPSSKAPRHRSATWPLSPATCCSERVASTSATTRWPATSASPAPDALRSPATIARLPSWARASIASLRIHPTCAWPWRRWKQPYTFRDRTAHVRSRSAISIFCPVTHRIARPCWNPAI